MLCVEAVLDWGLGLTLPYGVLPASGILLSKFYYNNLKNRFDSVSAFLQKLSLN